MDTAEIEFYLCQACQKVFNVCGPCPFCGDGHAVKSVMNVPVVEYYPHRYGPGAGYIGFSSMEVVNESEGKE